jgi:hypothetical protein
VARGIVYSKSALTSTGFDILLDHLRSGGASDGMWRTVARLVAFGEPGPRIAPGGRPGGPPVSAAPPLTVALSVYNNASYVDEAMPASCTKASGTSNS